MSYMIRTHTFPGRQLQQPVFLGQHKDYMIVEVEEHK